jgi:hypothetical protein
MQFTVTCERLRTFPLAGIWALMHYVVVLTVAQFLEHSPLSLREVAKYTGVSPSQVGRWQGGVVPYGLPLLRLVDLSAGKLSLREIVALQKKRGGPPRPRVRARRTRRAA